MATILNLNWNAYNQTIVYLKDISERGTIVPEGFAYQIARGFGRGIVKVNDGNQTIELTDTVDRETIEAILKKAHTKGRTQ